MSVTDGDTIRARFDDSGETERVRLTGIDTPETKDPRSVVECFGAEASAETHKLLPQGTAVRLETDVDFRDRFGRVLAYVWRVDDGLFVNAALVKGGWAAPFRYPPNVKYADRFSRLGVEAREAQRGLWARAVTPTHRRRAARRRRRTAAAATRITRERAFPSLRPTSIAVMSTATTSR